jgi:hypothetical protein
MGLWRWLERTLFTGEIVRDYGPLGELTGAGGPGEVSLLLCKRRGQFQLVVRTRGRFDLNWYPVPLTPGLAARLARIAKDLHHFVQSMPADDSPDLPPPAETGIVKRQDERD